MDEKSIRVCGLNFRLGVSTLEVDALRADGSLIDTAAIQARKGEQYQISGCGQNVLLGGEKRA